MPYCERFKGTSPRPAVRTSTTYSFAAKTNRPRKPSAPPRARAVKSSGASKSVFVRNILLIAGVVALFIGVRQFVEARKQGEGVFAIPDRSTDVVTNTVDAATPEEPRVENALLRYLGSNVTRQLAVTTRTAEGVVRSTELLGGAPSITNTPPAAPSTSTRAGNIYLGKYNDRTGAMEIVAQKRDGATSLDGAITALFAGPTSAEARNDVTTCIPDKAKYLGSRVSGDTAYLNFNSEFEFNPYGANGLKVELYQIVYTATQFPDVQQVVILINGESRETLGGDGRVANGVFSRENIARALPIE